MDGGGQARGILCRREAHRGLSVGCVSCVVVGNADAAWLWREGCFGSCLERRASFAMRSSARRHESAASSGSTPLQWSVLALEEAVHLLSTGRLHMACGTDADALVARMVREAGLAAAARLAVYRALRAGGWVVRGGTQYGADFLVYRSRPELEHAPAAVLVAGSAMTWRAALAVGRVAASARKRLVLAFVDIGGECASNERKDTSDERSKRRYRTRTGDINAVQISTLTQVDALAVKFMLLSRWAPEGDRGRVSREENT